MQGDEFQRRLTEALRTRLFPNGDLHLKQVAGGVGRSENTLGRWWRGETRILAEDVHRMAHFFAHRGDRNFLFDVFEDCLPARKDRPEVEEAALALVRSALDRLSVAAGDHDRCFWFTSEGVMANSPLGHADYVRRTLQLPEIQPGELLPYALRLLGWIAVTVRADGITQVCHDGRKVEPLAAERACEWLAAHDERILQVRRSIHIEGRWSEIHHDNVDGAITAISNVAIIVRRPRRPWVVKRLQLDTIVNDRLIELLSIHRQSPGNLIHAAAQLGAFTTSSVLRVEGEDVISHHAATAFELNQRSIEGQNVLARPDTDYALMIRERILQTKREGPTYHELSGTINNIYARYLNLALPEAGPGGRVLTSTVLLETEHLGTA